MPRGRMDTMHQQPEPLSLRWSHRALERLRQGYPEKFAKTAFQAYRMHCNDAYDQYKVFGLVWVWIGILWELQVKLPRAAGYPSLLRALRQPAQVQEPQPQAVVVTELPRRDLPGSGYLRKSLSHGKSFLTPLGLLLFMLLFTTGLTETFP